MNVANFPTTLMNLLGTSSSRSENRLEANAPLATVGNRNDSLIRIAGSLVRKGLSYEDISAALLGFNSQFDIPLDDSEVMSVAKSAMRWVAVPSITELDVARVLAQQYQRQLKYSPQHGWLAYDGSRWKRDPAGFRVQEAAKHLVDQTRDRIESSFMLEEDQRKRLLSAANRLRRAGAIRGIQQLAASSPDLCDEDAWDEAEGLLNMANGTLDLRTLELRAHDPADRLMKVLPYGYDPDATSPLFDKVVADVLDLETAELLMQLYGYALKGTGELQVMVILTGVGRNGKSTIMDAVANVFGDYSVAVDPAAFLKSANKATNNNEVAEMAGARLIVVPETNAGSSLDAAFIKRLSGGEKIYARKLYKEGFQFYNRGMVTMGTNMPPVFDGSDFGIARRMLPIVFERVISEANVDLDLPRKLRAEAPGILNRLLKGLRSYETNGGISIPQRISEATASLVRESNQVLQFTEHFYEVRADLTTRAGLLFDHYRTWAFGEGLHPMSQPAFRQGLKRTYPAVFSKRGSSGIDWHGIGLKKK